MKIVDVRCLAIGSAWRNLSIVVVRTDDGLEGVGEVRMVNHSRALSGYLDHAVPVHVIGHDPFEVESLVERMVWSDYERAGAIVMSGVAAIEIACWDILGKALDQPVHRLLGGAVRDRIKAYANGWYTVERTPQAFHAAARKVIERGYRALKVDPFSAVPGDLEREERLHAISLVEAVRDAVGPDCELLIEMHGRFTPAAAISLARELEPYEPSWIEEPVPPVNLKALKKVARKVRIPVATGERVHVRHELRELFERQAADVLQTDITGCGGLLEAKKIAAWADAYHIQMAPHNVGGPISTAAALHFAASTTNFKILEHFNDFDDASIKACAPGNPEVVDGYFALPSGAGLGVTVDEDVIRAHPPRQIYFNLVAEDWQLREGERSAAAD